MIAVVADDFTGAAEVAGVAVAHGLTAEVLTAPDVSRSVDVVVVDTSTRSATRDEARRRVGETIERLREAGVEWVYKKVDSVLRGHVVAELARSVEELGVDRALLVPANPSYGQTIRDGRYAIDDRPLSETSFAADPEHPTASSDVLTLLGPGEGTSVTWAPDPDRLAGHGIAVAAGEDREELDALARRVDGGTLAAGGAEFFAAVLRVRLGASDGIPVGDGTEPPPRSLVLVLGSGSERARAMLDRARAEGIPMVGLPARDADPSGADAVRARAALDALKARGRVILALDPGSRDSEVRDLPARLAAFARALLERAPESSVHWFVDGGTTASTVVRTFGWSRFDVVRVEGRGVTTLVARDGGGRRITVKPGGYPWPARILEWLR